MEQFMQSVERKKPVISLNDSNDAIITGATRRRLQSCFYLSIFGFWFSLLRIQQITLYSAEKS